MAGGGWPRCVAWDPVSGKQVASGGEDGVVRIVNAQSGTEDLAVREGEALLVRPARYIYRETVSAVAWRPSI